MTPEMMRFVREEIKRQLNVVLSGVSESGTDVQKESIGSMYPGMPTIQDRPVMHPFGFASRAPRGVIQVVAKQGNDPTNRIVLGHRDVRRPALNDGEVVMYNLGGYVFKLGADGVTLGNGGATMTFVLGEELVALLKAMLDAIVNHTHPSEGAPPTNAAAFQQLILQYLDPVPTILANKQGGF